MKVLVTGGTSGLGLAMASALAAAGATVALTGRSGRRASSVAADLRDTGITVNLLLPGGGTVTGMVPADAVPEGQVLLDPAVMGPPIVWLASDDAADVHDERIVAVEFERRLRDRGDGGRSRTR